MDLKTQKLPQFKFKKKKSSLQILSLNPKMKIIQL